MLTKSKAKLVRQLHDKKTRNETGLFLVEGEKAVSELLTSTFVIEDLFVTSEFDTKHKNVLKEKGVEYTVVEQQEIENIGTLESNDAALAVVKQKENTPLSVSGDEIILALDTVRDPGNLGTIIRIADWYGVTKIICSQISTDLYNSKTISASMGSFTRVSLFYTDISQYLKNTEVSILGAYLEGKDVHTLSFPKGGILVMGNESNGITDSISPLVTQKVSIPKFGSAESLNVSIATAVILDNWKRS